MFTAAALLLFKECSGLELGSKDCSGTCSSKEQGVGSPWDLDGGLRTPQRSDVKLGSLLSFGPKRWALRELP